VTDNLSNAIRLRGPVRTSLAAVAALGLLACEGASSSAEANGAGPAEPAAAAEAPKSGDARVDALLAAIASGDEPGVRKQVGDVGYMVASSGIVSTEDAFVERVLGCRTDSVERVRAVVDYRIVWACPSRDGGQAEYYNAAIATEAPFARDRTGLTILEFTAGRTNPYLGRGVAPPPPTEEDRNPEGKKGG
jgi:hypothetical protein